VRIYDPVAKTEIITPLPNTIGAAKCSSEDQTKCELVGLGMSDDGTFQGNYDLPAGLTTGNPEIQEINDRNVAARSSNRYQSYASKRNSNFEVGNTTVTNTGGRRLQGGEAQYIENPVVCTVAGSAMLFDSLSEEKYPVYEKDSLLNTNSNFDYGDFSSLPA